MQHNLRDPSRDRAHGRVYRVTAEGRPLQAPAKIAGEPIEALVKLLERPEDRVRYRAKVELGARDADKVIAAVNKWVAGLDKSDPDYEHRVLEALWVHQYQNVVDADLLKRVLHSPDSRARAAATRVLCYWRDRVPGSLELLKTLAADPYPRVRLEAVRAASFYTAPDAIEVPLISAEQPTDEALEFVRNETMKALEPVWKKAVAEGQALAVTSDVGARFLLRNVGTEEILKMKRSRGVDVELLFRKGIRDEVRTEALADLAKREKKGELPVLLEAIRNQDNQKGAQDESVVFDLARLLNARPPGDLAGARGEFERMATHATLPVTRQLGFLALVAADGRVDRAWDLAAKSPKSLKDLLDALPLIRDPSLRAELYPKVEPLLKGLPAELARDSRKEAAGRYVRVELPGKQRTLTLAEVEVYSDGRNVARQGKATQKTTAHSGDAPRAIDGNKDSSYGAGGQTHTAEGAPDPWWEVDLGADVPIDSIVIYNRADGELGQRLKGFTLKVLDAGRGVVFEKNGQPVPAEKVAFEVGGGSTQDSIRRAAMIALTTVRGREAETFRALARFVREGVDRHAAIQAIERIPAAYWPAEEARPLLDSLLGYARKLPSRDRTTPSALAALQLGDALAATLPLDQAKKVRAELGELGVRVIRVGTVPEQMIYDKERIVVKAGKPVQIVFENYDAMPHNFVVTRPGSLEELGQLGEATATQPGAAERNYVPPSDKILLASRLLQPRDAQTLDFNAPGKPGVYPYVCTYPGHWRRMYGSLYVVEDLDEYLADPEGYLAAHQLPIQDELLKSNRPRKEWKLDDLAADVKKLDHGRSYGNGKQIFQAATCVSCHKLNGAGQDFGPDLTKLDPKWTGLDILRNILEPSEKIDEKYATYAFATESGKVVTGMILEETPTRVKLIENPLAQTLAVILEKSDIADRKKAPASIMPKGLLDKLTREEILDLVAYLAARGDRNDPLFQAGGHAHHHGAGN